MTELEEVLQSTRQWIAQERLWDEQLYANTTVASAPAAMKSGRPTVAVSAPAIQPSRISPDGKKGTALAALHEQYKDCVRCPLGPSRIKFVFGVGSPDAEVMCIGEGPGYEEDRRGEPFVGKGGQLLDKILASIGLSRQTNAYIANIVKCHPMANPQTPEARGNDRPPTPEEVQTCSPILLQQIATVLPRFIVTLGSPSTRMILRTREGITQLRGRLFPFPVDEFFPERPTGDTDLFKTGETPAANPLAVDAETREALRRIQVLPTYHPAALLRNPNLKADTWVDMKLLRQKLAEPS